MSRNRGGPKAGSELVARVLKEQGVKHCFAAHPEDASPILFSFRSNDLEIVQMRDEHAAVSAADGYARTTGEVGLCVVKGLYGVTNALPGLVAAKLANSPVICLSEVRNEVARPRKEYLPSMGKNITKLAKRIASARDTEVELMSAVRQALTPPCGTALLELTESVLYEEVDEFSEKYRNRRINQEDLVNPGDPAKIDRVLQIVLNASRPLVVVGDDVLGSRAAANLIEFVEAGRIPICIRCTGRTGILPRNCPWLIPESFRKLFTSRADVVLALGSSALRGESLGRPPEWDESATYIQMAPTPSRANMLNHCDLFVAGDYKPVLRQLATRARELKLDCARHHHTVWTKELADARKHFDCALQNQFDQHSDQMPTHPARIARDLLSVIDPSSSIILDTYTLSKYKDAWYTPRFGGHVIDISSDGSVSHGVGMAVGVQLGRFSRQVILISDSASIVARSWEIGTALKYKLPILYLLLNRDTSQRNSAPLRLPTSIGDCETSPMVRYDRIFAEMGCYAENVERAAEFIPAVQRALRSCKPSVINVSNDIHL